MDGDLDAVVPTLYLHLFQSLCPTKPKECPERPGCYEEGPA